MLPYTITINLPPTAPYLIITSVLTGNVYHVTFSRFCHLIPHVSPFSPKSAIHHSLGSVLWLQAPIAVSPPNASHCDRIPGGEVTSSALQRSQKRPSIFLRTGKQKPSRSNIISNSLCIQSAYFGGFTFFQKKATKSTWRLFKENSPIQTNCLEELMHRL